MDINFLLQFLWLENKTKQKNRHFDIMQISYKRFSEFTVFSPAVFGRLLICCLGAHNESFGAIVLSVAITSRFTVFSP